MQTICIYHNMKPQNVYFKVIDNGYKLQALTCILEIYKTYLKSDYVIRERAVFA